MMKWLVKELVGAVGDRIFTSTRPDRETENRNRNPLADRWQAEFSKSVNFCTIRPILRTRLLDARLSRAGVDEAVAGFVADVGMHEPPPQEAFTD
jgi:hypothetical protein